ncbi:helix-turn-helix domain-containing protein [Natrarchaeobius sp. A-rgal3]
MAITYKNGVAQTELAEWHNTGRQTIYSWFKRLDTDGSLEQAVTDTHQSGRKQNLSEK